MDYRIALVGVALLIGIGTTRSAYADVSNVQIVKGTCSSASHTVEGPNGIDLTKRQSRFYCNAAAITFFDDAPGHVLINFSEKDAQHSPTLGFAGKILAFQAGDVGMVMPVSNVYLERGQATPVSDGWCKLFIKGKDLTGIECGITVNAGDRKTVAIIVFDPAPSQSIQSAVESNLPNEEKIETLTDGTKVLILPNGNKVETLTDGTTWAVIHPGDKMLAIQLDPTTMPSEGAFQTVMIVNRPDIDIVGAPQSERIRIQGDCQSRTYQIMSVLPYAGKNGGGLPDVNSAATEPEGVLRKVKSESLIWHVFNLACKTEYSNER